MSIAKVTVSVNRKKITSITARMKAAGNLTVVVGVMGEKAAAMHAASPESARLTNVEIGLIHEFGAPKAHIPERSFLRSTFAEQREKVIQVAAKAAQKVYADESGFERRLGQIGLYLAAEVKKKIVSKIAPPNAPSTIARKGSSTPLVDTGQLLDSITHAIKREG